MLHREIGTMTTANSKGLLILLKIEQGKVLILLFYLNFCMKVVLAILYYLSMYLSIYLSMYTCLFGRNTHSGVNMKWAPP